MSGDQRPSEVISRNQSQSVAIRGHQRSSEVIRGHQRSSHLGGGELPLLLGLIVLETALLLGARPLALRLCLLVS